MYHLRYLLFILIYVAILVTVLILTGPAQAHRDDTISPCRRYAKTVRCTLSDGDGGVTIHQCETLETETICEAW